MHRSPEIRLMSVSAFVVFAALLVYSGLQVTQSGALDAWLQISAGPITVYSFDVLIFAALALVLFEVVARQGPPVPRANRTVIFITLGYCAYQLAVVFPVTVIFYDFEPIGVLRELEVRLGLALVPFVYLVVLRYISVSRVILLVNVTAVAVALHAIYTYMSFGSNFSIGKFRVADGHAAFLFTFLILTALFLYRRTTIGYAAALLGLLGMVFINHRSAYLALAIVGVPLVFHFRRASARTAVALLVVLSFAVLVLTMSAPVRESALYSLSTMVSPTADQNSRDRIERSRLGLDYFLAHPLGDHAWNQRFYLIDLLDPFEPHNFVVQLLNQQGVVGLGFFVAFIFTVARIGWRNRSADRVSAVMLASIAFYLLFSLFNTTILSSWNILLLAVPTGILLKRNAEILEESGLWGAGSDSTAVRMSTSEIDAA